MAASRGLLLGWSDESWKPGFPFTTTDFQVYMIEKLFQRLIPILGLLKIADFRSKLHSTVNLG